jgi:phosphoribosylglycinamide formyltransferase-1
MQKSGNNGSKKKTLAILASGRGSNARAILDFFSANEQVDIALIVSNNPGAGVLQLAAEYGVETMVINRKQLRETALLDDRLAGLGTDLIVLAGFLWLIPQRLLTKFPGRIVNIHPALLPKYGGKGMFGMNVHHAVKEAGEQESGISIHLIDEHYDEGRILFQASTRLEPSDTPEEIAAKVLALEHYHYPRIIEDLLTGKLP